MNELASQFGFSYDVRTADIDEKAIRHPEPRQLVTALAHAKADAIIAKMRAERWQQGAGSPPQQQQRQQLDVALDGFLITCDQVVVHEGLILEKPDSADEARRFIAGYGRAPASTVGSVLCTNLATGARACEVDVCTIHFDPIPDSTVDTLIAEGNVMWCAGKLRRKRRWA